MQVKNFGEVKESLNKGKELGIHEKKEKDQKTETVQQELERESEEKKAKEGQ